MPLGPVPFTPTCPALAKALAVTRVSDSALLDMGRFFHARDGFFSSGERNTMTVAASWR